VDSAATDTLNAHAFDMIAAEVYRLSDVKGYHRSREHLPKLDRLIVEAMLISTEVSEFVEGLRERELVTNPPHLMEELADVVIRVLDTAEHLRICHSGVPTLGAAIEAKLLAVRARPAMDPASGKGKLR
jgi:hypothetical protein